MVYHIWEFATAFCTYFLINRLTMWIAARGIKGADIELWRGWQMWIWLAPNHIKSIWKVIKSETWLRKVFRSKQIAFNVTKKGNTGTNSKGAAAPTDLVALWDTFCVTWYFVLYDLLFIGAIIFTVWAGQSFLLIFSVLFLAIDSEPLTIIYLTNVYFYALQG